jgi:hypothetical protein
MKTVKWAHDDGPEHLRQQAAIAEANAREAEADAVRWREAAEHARREAVRREAKQNTR